MKEYIHWLNSLQIGDTIQYESSKQFSFDTEIITTTIIAIGDTPFCKFTLANGAPVDINGIASVGGGFEIQRVQIQPIDNNEVIDNE